MPCWRQSPGDRERVSQPVPTSLAHGITTEAEAPATLSLIYRDATRFPDRPFLWPLMIGAWRHKEPDALRPKPVPPGSRTVRFGA
jgi:hypothetical protein